MSTTFPTLTDTRPGNTIGQLLGKRPRSRFPDERRGGGDGGKGGDGRLDIVERF